MQILLIIIVSLAGHVNETSIVLALTVRVPSEYTVLSVHIHYWDGL